MWRLKNGNSCGITSNGVSYSATVIPNVTFTEATNGVDTSEFSNTFSVININSDDVVLYWNSILHPGESVWW